MLRPHVGGHGVLFMHEVHKVRGRAEDQFEAAFRDGWMPMLGAGDDARLLWYANHAHGSGPSYTVVTVTAVRDGTAGERLALRVQSGDLQGGRRDRDELRTTSRPNYWSRSRGRHCETWTSTRCRPTGGSTSRPSTWRTPCGPSLPNSMNTA